MIRRTVLAMLGVALVGLIAVPAVAQQMYIYPTQNQSPDQQSRDRYECHIWAVQQTGVDPTNPQMAAAPPPQEAQQGGVLRGGARGATVGVIGGAIAGDAGKGAAIGAATGALIGGMRRRDQQRRQEQQRRNYEQQQAQAVGAYNRALTACLRGRGYTVN
jgi:hypothetical protein